MLKFFYAYLLGWQIERMINHEDPYTNLTETFSDFEKIGVRKLESMGILPFINFSHKGTAIKPQMPDKCKETNGDCLKWLNKYLTIEWREWDEMATK